MASSIWISIPTTDLGRARSFYEGMGFRIDPAFSDDNGVCVVLGDTQYLMVVTREFLGTMTDKTIVDPRTHVQAGINLTFDSREEVDSLVSRGLAAGGTEARPAQDHGFMYARDLDDPDGNNIGFLWMAPQGAEEDPRSTEQPAAATASA